MNAGHKIIICGVDGAGKSTYVDKILKENPDMNYRVVHCTRHTPNDYQYFMNLLLSEDNIILDRGPYGQFVYQTKLERDKKDQLTLFQLCLLEEIINRIDAEVWYVFADHDVCFYNCKRDADDSYYTLDYIKELDAKFRQVLSMSSVRNLKYIYNDYHPDMSETPKTEVDVRNFDYKSLPHIVAVDFDGTLVTGKPFPEIGELNQKLVYELFEGKYKDSKKILYTHRSHEALVDACNFLVQNGLYFDAINDDIPEVKEALHRDHKKVYFDIMIDDKAINVSEFL